MTATAPAPPADWDALAQRVPLVVANMLGVMLPIAIRADGTLERNGWATHAAGATLDDGDVLIPMATRMRISRLLEGRWDVHVTTPEVRASTISQLATDFITILHESVHAVLRGIGVPNDGGATELAVEEGLAEIIGRSGRGEFMRRLGVLALLPELADAPFYYDYPAQAAFWDAVIDTRVVRTGERWGVAAGHFIQPGPLSATLLDRAGGSGLRVVRQLALRQLAGIAKAQVAGRITDAESEARGRACAEIVAGTAAVSGPRRIAEGLA